MASRSHFTSKWYVPGPWGARYRFVASMSNGCSAQGQAWFMSDPSAAGATEEPSGTEQLRDFGVSGLSGRESNLMMKFPRLR